MLYETNELINKKRKAYYKRQEKLERQIKELTKKKDKMRFPDFERVFTPLADAVKKELHADAYEFYGPFGLCCQWSIYWKKNKNKSITVVGNVLGAITIEDGDPLRVRDESKNTGEFKQGTIGEMNGMNHPTHVITPEMDMNWLLNWVKRQ